METDFSFNSLRDDVQNCILTSSTMILNNEGFELLKETTEAVRTAILKVNAFKQYLKDQSKLSPPSISQDLDELRLNQLNITAQNPLLSAVDTKLQVFFTIPDKKITESEVREAVEKEGFEDFIITLKNRQAHSFGFIKFSTEDAVNRALDMSQKISVNNLLVKIRPDRGGKSNAATSVTNNEDANNVSHTIDESLLINISSGYQHRRILSNYSEPVYDEVEQNETSMNVEPEKSFAHPSEPETPLINISHFIDSVKENVNEDTSIKPLMSNDFSSRMHINEPEMECNQNDHYDQWAYQEGHHSSEKNKVYRQGRHSSEKNKFCHRNKGNNCISKKKNPTNGFKKNFQRPRYCSPDNNVSSMNGNRNYNISGRNNDRNKRNFQ